MEAKGCRIVVIIKCDKCGHEHERDKPCKPCKPKKEKIIPFPCIAYKLKADFLFVGGGMAACAAAERITRSGRFSAILIENGPNYNNNVTIKIAQIDLQQQHYPEFFYQGNYMPEPSTANRNNIPFSQGRGLSGGSLVFGQIYNRGTEQYWDQWRAVSTFWNSQVALDLYKKLERFREDGATLNDPGNHGRDGLQPIRLGNVDSTSFAQFLAAIKSTGAVGTNILIDDYNNYATPIGVFKLWQYFQTVAPVERAFVSRTFLGPQVVKFNEDGTKGKGVNGRKLRVFTQTVGTKIFFDDSECASKKNTAQGIFALRNSVPTFYSANETILSCGYHTPQVLQINGFGDAQKLQQANVKVRADLPGVGNTFKNGPVLVSLMLPPQPGQPNAPTTNTQPGTFLSFGAFLPDQRPGADPTIRKYQFDGSIVNGLIPQIPGNVALFVLQPLRPKSTGTANIQDGDYTHIQKAFANYYEDPDDLESTKAFFTKVLAPMAVYLINTYGYIQINPPLTTLQDNPPGSLEAFIRANAGNTHHYQCFDKIGRPEDGGVVDEFGRVHFANHLRAVDDGMAPFPTDGNTGGTAQVIGLGVAEQILREHGEHVC